MSGSFTQGTYPRHGPYSLIACLPPATSANRLPRPTRPPLAQSPGFHRASGVGSEEAPHGAGLRPPLKRLVRFSRKPLSQRCRARVQGWNQRDKAYKPVFDDKLALRQVSPPSIAPSLVAMRPNAPHDPAVKLVEEPPDMGLAVVPAPTSNDRVDLADQPLRIDWSLTAGALADLVLEVLDGFCTWKCIARSPARPASDLRGLQPQRPLALLDRVAEKLKPVSNVHNPGLLGVQAHTQPGQYPLGHIQCRAGFPISAARQQPVVGISGQPIATTTASPNQTGSARYY